METNKDKAVLIIGMHRCGTSALAGLFSQMGYSIGQKVMPPGEDNPKGYYENRDIQKFNDKVLSLCNSSWDGLVTISNILLQLPNLEELVNEGCRILKDQFPDSSKILVKDPRISLLFPIWEMIFAEYGVEPKVIVCFRRPCQVADSLKIRNEFEEATSVLLYSNYLLHAELHSRNHIRCFVDFENLVNRTASEIKTIFKKIELENTDLEFTKSKLGFIESKLRNNKSKRKINSRFDIDAESLFALISGIDKTKKTSNLKLETFLKNQISTYDNISNTFYKNLILSNNIWLKSILFDNEGNVKKKKHNLKLGKNLITIKNTFSRSNLLRIRPCNALASINLESINYIHNGQIHPIPKLHGIKLLIEYGNSSIVDKQSLLDYSTEDIPLDAIIELNITLNNIGISAITGLSEMNTNVSNWHYENLKNKEASFLEQIGELTSSINDQEELNKTLKLRIESKEQTAFNQSIQLKAEIDSLNLKLNKSTNSFSEKQIEITKTQTELSKIQEELSKTTEELSITKEEGIRAQEELANISSEFAAKQEEFLQTKSKLTTKIEMIEKQKNEISTLERINQELNLNNKKAQEELQTKIKDLASKLEEVNKLKSELELDFIKTKFDASNKNDKSTLKIESLEKQLDSIQEIKSELSILTESNLKLKEELSYKKAENDFLNKSLEEKDSRLNLINKELSEVRIQETKHLDALNETSLKSNQQLLESEKLKIELNSNKKSLSNSLEDNQKTKDEYQMLERQLQETKSKLKEQSSNNKLIHLENATLSDENAYYNEFFLKYLNELQGVTSSLSYRLGFGLTAPLRFVYDKAKGVKTERDSNLMLLMQLAKAGVRNPIKMLGSLNAENIKRFSHAIKTEDPALIAENLTKYAENKEVGEVEFTINERTSETKFKSIHQDAIIEPDSDEDKVNYRILFICPSLPDYDGSAGGKRAFKMLCILAKEFEVFIFTKGEQQSKYVDILERNGITILPVIDVKRLKRRIPKFDTIIFGWYSTYFDCNDFILNYPSAQIILDSVDIHWIREERSIGNWDGIDEAKQKYNKKRELEAYANADLIWVVTEPDKQAVLKELPNADIRVVSIIEEPIVTEYADSGTKNILFLGGYRHYPNVAAVKRLAKEILPTILKTVPDTKLIIAGSHAPDDVKELATNNKAIIFKGFIASEDLNDLYRNSQLIICPLLAGAGIKGKICEAISHMVPIVTNKIGNEGINLRNEVDGFIGETNEELVAGALKILKREADLSAMTVNAQSKLYDLVGPEVVKKNMINSILPEVSICIVTYNQVGFLQDCIASIIGNTIYQRYRIIVHSNGCTDGSKEYLQAAQKVVPNLEIVLSKENNVFVKPNNWMMQKYTDNDVVLINNDVTVTRGWLMNLVKTAYEYDNAGIVGSKILYPNGVLQEFGGELYADGTGVNIGKNQDANEPKYNSVKRCSFVSGCSLYIKRVVLDSIGYFDEQFHPCYCEDADICYTAWQNGFEVLVTPKSIIYHHEGGTAGTDVDNESGFKRFQKINFEKFIKKHNDNIVKVNNKVKQLNN